MVAAVEREVLSECGCLVDIVPEDSCISGVQCGLCGASERLHSAVRRVRDRLVLERLQKTAALVAVGLRIGGTENARGKAGQK